MTLSTRTPGAADGCVRFRTCTADAETGLARFLTLVADADGGLALLPGLSEDAEQGRALLSTRPAECGRAAAAALLLAAERGRRVQSCSKLCLAAADEPPHGPTPSRGTASMAGLQFASVALSTKEEQEEVAASAAESRCCAWKSSEYGVVGLSPFFHVAQDVPARGPTMPPVVITGAQEARMASEPVAASLPCAASWLCFACICCSRFR